QTTCRGTEGKTVSVSVAEAKVPGLAYVGGITTTQNGSIGQDKSAITFTSKVAGVKLGDLSISAIESSASAWKTKDGKTGVSSSSKVVSVTVGNKTYDVPNQPNQTLDIPGIAKLTFNQVKQQSRYVSVDALVIDAYSLKSTVVIGHAAAGVVG
ncbi:MAG TPA: choice-of-anchor P family protein, partial [Kribbella sp.]